VSRDPITTAVDVSNVDQARAWDGDEGSYWATHHQIFESTLDRYQRHYFAAAGIQAGHHVLDIGCGTGATTRRAARLASAGHVKGVDLSARMLDVGRALARAEGLDNVSFDRADAQVHPFPDAAYDRVLSCTGAMFFGRPELAFANLHRSLTASGRIVLLTWQSSARQEWFADFTRALTGRTPQPSADLPGPFSLSEPPRIERVLREGGFGDIACNGVAESTFYGRTAAEAHAFLLGLMGWMLGGQDAQRRAAAEQDLWDTLHAHETDDGVRYESAAWVVTARREATGQA
jgi:SAM-dependent methyltransferase